MMQSARNNDCNIKSNTEPACSKYAFCKESTKYNLIVCNESIGTVCTKKKTTQADYQHNTTLNSLTS